MEYFVKDASNASRAFSLNKRRTKADAYRLQQYFKMF